MKRQNNVGLTVSQPMASCNSEKCPWHGYLKVRGRIFKGKVVSAKAPKTAIVEWDYYHYVPKYERYERRRSRIAALNPDCITATDGDFVIIGECRPISKSKRFVVIEKIK